MRKVKRSDPCFNGCDTDEIVIEHGMRFGEQRPAKCLTCGREYIFHIIIDEYPQGDVLIYVLECSTKSNRNKDYDFDCTVILREPDLPAGDKGTELKIIDFLGSNDN